MKILISLFSIVLCLSYGKAQWVELDTGMENPPVFNDVYAITSDIVVVVGANGTILKTTDGGETWQQKDSGTTENLRKVQFPIQDIGYVVGDSGIVLKTTDSGETWVNIDTGQSSNFEGLSVVDEDLVVISYYNNLIKSEDGGNSWVNYSMNSFYYNYIQFFNSLIGYSAKESGILAKTIDGGQTWHELSGFVPFYFLNENIGFYHEGGLLKTIDGGDTFEYVGSGISELFSNITAVGENTIWGIFAGFLNGDGSSRGLMKITYSETEPYTEDIWYDDDPGIDMFSIHFAENTGYIVGYKGNPVIWKNGTGINTMSTTDETLKDEIKIYPNPVSNEINIEVEKGNLQDYMVSLTDMAGKQIYSKSFKEKKIKINTSHFQKGIYILSIETKDKKHSQKLIIN